ncbi:MAG: hypothetical protein GTN78_00605 [Gemmatimonadales bacterium]|nr:hypothetical protein [Gemmatimonadales bacterium]NIN10039.1 hypothetical protein [Gemmatimonadales bacterium]NIQ98692.1 hypothetical protein [Gemmatimonadales bacterium]NIS63568.1 hypothetical protein [Gemmatimonadales bacterium]
MSQRILVVANKSWEADPLVGVLLSKEGVPRNLGSITVVNHPFFMSQRVGPDPVAKPRIEITLDAPATSVVEVWCIEDLMNPKVSGSSTLEKVRVLPWAFSYQEAPDLVIAFGTAAAPGDVNLIGSVVVGSSVFLHDPFAKSSHREGLWDATSSGHGRAVGGRASKHSSGDRRERSFPR